MYLSRIALDTNLRETRRALASPQVIHCAVEHGFGGEKHRNLWRIDNLGSACYLLVLSPQKVDYAHLVRQFGFPNAEHAFETRDYEPLLARIQHGQTWRFRLTANPVRSSARDKDEATGRGQVHAHVTQAQQRLWLQSRAEAYGFLLADGAFDVVEAKWLKFGKGIENRQDVTLRTAAFEGVLTVIDLERFRQTLLSGIGRAKAYGCGLLTIARMDNHGYV